MAVRDICHFVVNTCRALTYTTGVLVSSHGGFKLEESAFKPLAKEVFVDAVRKLVDAGGASSHLHVAFADEFVSSLERLRTICTTAAELRYLESMSNIATWAVTDPVESELTTTKMVLGGCLHALGFCEHSFIYHQVGEMNNEEFMSLVDPNNYPSQLVLLHLFVLDFVMSRKTVDQASDSLASESHCRTGFDGRRSTTVIWIERIMERLPEEYHPYAEGAIAFVRYLTSFSLAKDGTWKPLLPPG